MFERYTEGARRVIFFGRAEAAQMHCSEIDPVHLLAAITQEGKNLLRQTGTTDVEQFIAVLRNALPQLARSPRTTENRVDIPLSESAKRVLAHGLEEADAAGDRLIRVEHLLAGILREDAATAELASTCGTTLENVHRVAAERATESPLGDRSKSAHFRIVPEDCVEFSEVVSGDRVAIMPLKSTTHVPRVGDVLAFDQALYSVIEVQLNYGERHQDYAVAELSSVRVWIKRLLPPGAAEAKTT